MQKKGGFMPDFFLNQQCDFAMFVFDLLTGQHRQWGGSLFVLLLMMEILTSEFVGCSGFQPLNLIRGVDLLSSFGGSSDVFTFEIWCESGRKTGKTES